MNFPSLQISRDLEEIFPLVVSDLQRWEGKNILITGGTGFFGKWLLETLHFAREKGQIRFGHVYVLSRSPEAFVGKNPHLNNFDFIEGDIRSFPFPQLPLHGIVHGATSASAQLNADSPREMFETIVEGTRRALLCAKESPGCRFLMISSGAVYGKRNLSDGLSLEKDFDCSDVTKLGDAYADGKRTAEMMVVAEEFNQSSVIARCFAFVGPHLPLRTHFAVGNFIANCLDGNSIVIKGNGSPRRTYLYPTDLVCWLLGIWGRGLQNQAFNVGSDKLISIEELAHLVKREAMGLGLSAVPIQVSEKFEEGGSIPCYAPNIEKAQESLGLVCRVALPEAIRRTFKFYLEEMGGPRL